MPKTAVALAPIIKTRMHKRFIRHGSALTEREECWQAETTDGVWRFGRGETAATLWDVIHIQAGISVHLTSNLRACQEYVATGHAQKALERLQAHDRGEHDGNRDTWCGKC